MQIQLNALSLSVTVTMSPVQYALLATGFTKDQKGFERLIQSYCQQVDLDQDLADRVTLDRFLKEAPKAERKKVLENLPPL